MNATTFYTAIAFAVIILGLFAFLVGAKSQKAKTLKAKNDEHGYQTTMEDLVKMTASAIVVLAVVMIAVLGLLFAAPSFLTLPLTLIGDPVSFCIITVSAALLASFVGFAIGAELQARVDKQAASSAKSLGSKALLGFIIVSAVFSIVPHVAAATTVNMSDEMQPVTDILVWGGNDMAPALIILFMGLVPVIMLTIGVRFAGGLMASLLEGIRDIFTFKF